MAIEHADFAGVERLALVTGMEKRYCFFNKHNSHSWIYYLLLYAIHC